MPINGDYGNVARANIGPVGSRSAQRTPETANRPASDDSKVISFNGHQFKLTNLMTVGSSVTLESLSLDRRISLRSNEFLTVDYTIDGNREQQFTIKINGPANGVTLRELLSDQNRPTQTGRLPFNLDKIRKDQDGNRLPTFNNFSVRG